MPERYTRRAESSGWLTVRLTKGDKLISVCEFTGVDRVREVGNRTHFTIADGWIAVGDEASLTTANAKKYLSNVPPSGAAHLTVTYDGAPRQEVSPVKGPLLQQWATLLFAGGNIKVTLNSVWNGTFQPIPPGIHAIMSPDYSHQLISTAGYAAMSPGMIGNDVWFPIGVNGAMVNSSRYIHVGHLSDGCVTVHQIERWSALYAYLISHRVPGSRGKKVGNLVVRR